MLYGNTLIQLISPAQSNVVLTMEWNYCGGYLIFMSNYLTKTLKKFQRTPPFTPQFSPHKMMKPTFNSRIQYVSVPDTSLKLDKQGKILAQ